MKKLLIAIFITIVSSTSVFAQQNVVNELIRCNMYFDLEDNPKYDEHRVFVYSKLISLGVAPEEVTSKRNTMIQMVADSGVTTSQAKKVLFKSCLLFFGN